MLHTTFADSSEASWILVFLPVISVQDVVVGIRMTEMGDLVADT